MKVILANCIDYSFQGKEAEETAEGSTRKKNLAPAKYFMDCWECTANDNDETGDNNCWNNKS